MVELIVIYCLIWGALIIGAFVADFITDVSTSKQRHTKKKVIEIYKLRDLYFTNDKLTDWDKYVQHDESEV